MVAIQRRYGLLLTAILITISAVGCNSEQKEQKKKYPTLEALEKQGVKVTDAEGMADATGASREAISALEKDKIFVSASTKESLGQVNEVSFSYFQGSLNEKLPTIVPLLKQIPNLSLKLGLSDVDATGVASLAGMDNIIELNLNQMNVGDEVMSTVASLNNLQAFHHQPKDKDSPGISGSGLKQLTGLPKLQELNIVSTNLTDGDSEVLKELKALTKLSITGHNLTDKSMETLAELPQLRVLYVSIDKLTPDGIKPLSKLANLEEVTVYGLKINPPHRELLKKLPEIKKVNGDAVKKET